MIDHIREYDIQRENSGPPEKYPYSETRFAKQFGSAVIATQIRL